MVSLQGWPTTRSIYMATFTTVQGLLSSFGLARNDDPETSKAAAKTIPASLEAQVLAAFRSFPDGATADQIVEHLGLRWNSVTPRFKRLMEQGLIEDTGRRVKGVSGRSQRVLKAV
jgi:DNA-binding transcriptional ArsR family regulator